MENIEKVYGISIYDSDDWGEWNESTHLEELYLTKEKVEQEVKRLKTDIGYLCERCYWLDKDDMEEIKNIEEDTNIRIIISEHILIK